MKDYLIKLILISVIVIIVSGCGHYVLSSTGYIRPPKNYRFPYEKRAIQLKTIDVIDTTCIYYLHDSYFKSGGGTGIYAEKTYKRSESFIRFYADGRLKLQGTKGEYPKIEDINNINNGLAGFYLLKGRQIKIQLYSDINAGSDQLKYGYIDDNDNLILYDANPRTYISIFNLFSEKNGRKQMEKGYFGKMSYEKISVKGMTYINPNW
jgi:hypothetical protein